MPQTYYDFDPWKRAADNIASGMVAVAQARNRKAMFDAEQAAMAPVREAQVEKYKSGVEYDRAQTAKVQGETERAASQNQALAALGKFFAENLEVDQESGVARLREGRSWGEAMQFIVQSSRGGNDAALAFGNTTKALQRPGEEKAKLTNRKEVEQMKLDASAGKPLHARPGDQFLDPATLELRYSVPSAAAAREMYDTVTETIPATPDTPGTPADSGKRSFIFDWLAKDVPPTPAVPGQPGTPERRVTRKIPAGTPLSSLTPPPTQEQGVHTPAAAPAVPPVAERVAGDVYDLPKGRFKWTGTGWVPAE